jgi:hypothetical protein
MKKLVGDVDPLSRDYLGQWLCAAAVTADDLDFATSCATDQLARFANKKDDWNHGNVIHHANLALGEVALRRGKVDEAAGFLKKAGATPGSPQLNDHGPDVELAKKLLAAGRTEDVAAFAIACKRFWVNGGDAPEEWARMAKAHGTGQPVRVPSFQLAPAAASEKARQALDRFWAAGKDRSGRPFQAADEKERTAVPISPDHAASVVRMGVVTGLAVRCKMEWEGPFFAFMKAQRARRTLSEKQNTFMGVLHGTIQRDAVARSALLDCSTAFKEEIRSLQAEYTAMKSGAKE